MRRYWWAPLIPTVAAVVALLAAPPMSGYGQPCDHPMGWIVITPGYTDGEIASYEDGSGNRTCARAAWSGTGFAAGIGAVGGAGAWGLRWVGNRRHRIAGSGELSSDDTDPGRFDPPAVVDP